MSAKTSNVAIPFLLLGFLLSPMCLAQTAPSLTVSQDAAGNVSASVSASINSCGITAADGVPTFSIDGAVIAVTQPVIAVMCVNPRPPQRLYQGTVVFGQLPAATYTVNWNFPALTASYTVLGSDQPGAGDPTVTSAPTLGIFGLLGMVIGMVLIGWSYRDRLAFRFHRGH